MGFLKGKFEFLKSLEKYSFGGKTLPDLFIKLGLILSLVFIIPIMFPSGRSFKYTDLAEGSIASKKVIASFTFVVLKTDDELQNERADASEEIPYYFARNDTINKTQGRKLEELFGFLRAVNINIKKGGESRTEVDSTITDSLSVPNLQEEIRTKFRIFIKSPDIESLMAFTQTDNFLNSRRDLVREFTQLDNILLMDLNKDEILNNKIIKVENGLEEEIPFGSPVDSREIVPILNRRLLKFANSKTQVRLFQLLLEPNFQYLEELTEQRRNEAVAAVPLGIDMVFENERIVDANERITKNIYQKLVSLEYAIAERSEEEGDLQNTLAYLGKYLLTALILLLYVIYLSANRPKIFADNKKLLLITILIFLQVGVGALLVGPLGWPLYVIPTTISSMLLGVLFDPGIGFVGTVVIGLLLAGITGFDYSFAILTMFVGLISIYSVTRIRTRNQIFKAILYILSAYIVVVFTIGTLRYEELKETFQIFLYFLLPNAILSPFVTYMMLGVFERLFDITTDVTLLELSDLNNPLLKELSVKAPGTFHHSVIVGNLAESAALTIGANSLLARVGSYYHDIGKMVKPEYFVENQKEKANKHDSLAPNMSALILASHVKNGIEMAEKNRLPKLIRDFIPEHHGKNLMSFFYNKALEDKETKDINKADYRYPGPSPRSKETAIVMLADTIEAATRTLSNPTAGRLRKQVEELVEQRFLEGELDDSDLTTRDLKGIIDGFMSVLLGIYHQRIEYPKSNEVKKNHNSNGIKKEKLAKES